MLVAFAECHAQVEVGVHCASLSTESALVLDTVCQSRLGDWFEVEHEDDGEDFCKDFSEA